MCSSLSVVSRDQRVGGLVHPRTHIISLRLEPATSFAQVQRSFLRLAFFLLQLEKPVKMSRIQIRDKMSTS